MTPAEFYHLYLGKAIDYDGAYGIQCVDAFKVGCEYLNIPAVATPNNWADGYWTCLDSNGHPSPSTETWRDKYFDRVKHPEDFRDGDWVIWARSSASHPSSHIAMYYDGKEFGENQGGDRSFSLKSTNFTDALGALRPKAWSLTIPVFDSDLTISGHLYKLYRQNSGMKAVVLSPGLNMTAPIRAMDCNASVFAKITGCNYFQNDPDNPAGQPYGMTFGDISSPINGVYQNLPGQDNTMFFDLDTGLHADCTGITIDPTHNVFSPALIYQRGKNVQYARMVGLGQCNVKSTYTFLIRFSGGDYCMGLSDQSLTPNQIAQDLMQVPEVDSISFLDGGGSAQMMRYIMKEHRTEYTRETPRATAGCIAFISGYTEKPKTEPQTPETGKDEEDTMTEQKPQESTELAPVEGWTDPEPAQQDHIILQRIASLMSVKSIITLALTAAFIALVVNGKNLPDDFVNIYTMCISFFFGYQFKKAEK
jgi:hypothetical protein